MQIDLFYEFEINEDNLWKLFFFDMDVAGIKMAFDHQDTLSQNMFNKDKICIGEDFIAEYAKYLNREAR